MPPSAILSPAFLTLAVANLLFFTGLAGFVLLPLHLHRLGATEGQLGLIMACYSATAIVVQPVVGAWVDRGGHRAFLVTGAVLTSGAALLFAAVPDALGLFPLLRALQGVAFSVFFIANFTVVVDLVPPDRRGQALGIFGISGLVSGAVGPALGELVVRGAGFRGLFLAAAALPLLAAGITARLRHLPERRPVERREGLPGLLRGIVAAPRLPMTLGAAFGLGQGVMFTFFPTYALSLGVGWVGLFAVSYSGAALGVRATASSLADTAGRRAVIIPALALQAAATVLLAGLGILARSLGLPAGPFLALAGVLAGGAHGLLYPALTALVVDVTPPERRGRVVGVFMAFILLGQAGGAAGFGYLAHALGYGPMFAVLSLVLAGACAAAFRLER
ncbi:MAG TPA: MFS transporter [Methylomirabilota bacterium]|jgi:MFS family permease